MTSINMCFVHVSKDRWGHLVEWVMKSSFSFLNKLFEIDQSKRSHGVLLTEKNQKVILAQVKPFVIPLFPKLAPPTLVSSEHFVLKDLPFYEVARLADIEAKKSHLDTNEKKHQERQAFGSTSRVTSNLSHLASKKEDHRLVSGLGDPDRVKQDIQIRANPVVWDYRASCATYNQSSRLGINGCQSTGWILWAEIEKVERGHWSRALLKETKDGWKGLSFKLAINASSILIPPSSPAPKAQDMENIPFHGLGETVTISSDDSMPSTHTSLVAPADVPNWLLPKSAIL